MLFINEDSIYVVSNQCSRPRKPSGRVLEVTGSIPSQGPRYTKRRYTNCTSSSLVKPWTLNRDILALSQELRRNIDLMDTIWDENPSKSKLNSRCGGMKNPEWPRRTDKSRTLKKEEEKCSRFCQWVGFIVVKSSNSRYKI